MNKLHRKKVASRWSADHLPTTYQPLTDHLPITYRPLTDHLPTTYRPPTDHLLTTYWPLTDHLLTTYRPLTDQSGKGSYILYSLTNRIHVKSFNHAQFSSKACHCHAELNSAIKFNWHDVWNQLSSTLELISARHEFTKLCCAGTVVAWHGFICRATAVPISMHALWYVLWGISNR